MNHPVAQTQQPEEFEIEENNTMSAESNISATEKNPNADILIELKNKMLLRYIDIENKIKAFVDKLPEAKKYDKIEDYIATDFDSMTNEINSATTKINNDYNGLHVIDMFRTWLNTDFNKFVEIAKNADEYELPHKLYRFSFTIEDTIKTITDCGI